MDNALFEEYSLLAANCQFFVLYLSSVEYPDRAQYLWVASSTSSGEITVKVSMVIFEGMSCVFLPIFPILLTHKVDKYIQYHG